MNKRNKGFTLIELTLVLLITAILAGIAIPTFQYFMKKAKGIEAQLALNEIRRLERIYYEENERYSSSLSDIGFSPMQPLRYYQIIIEPISDQARYTARAEGNIDRDPGLDIWTINEGGTITHLDED